MAPDVKAYADAISRLSCIFSLASLVPVILESRFGSALTGRHRPRPPPQQDKKDGDRKDKKDADRKEKKDGNDKENKEGNTKEGDSSKEPALEEEQRTELSEPLGIPSVLLLVASEVAACHDIFFSPFTAKSKSKAKGGVPGSFGVLLNGMARAQKGTKASQGALEKASTIVVEALNPADAFATAHSLMMLVALSVATVSLLGRFAKAIPEMLERGGQKLLRNVALIAAVVIFAACNFEALSKTGRAIMSENLMVTLQLPLRVAGLIFATPPGPDPEEEGMRAGGTPTMFATLQAASLAASLSAGIASGELASAVAPFTQKAFLAAAWDSKAFTLFGPMMLAITWIALMHLQKKPGHLTMAAILSCLSSPVLIASGWPKLATAMGLKTEKEHAKGIIQLLSLTYAAGAGSMFVTGGTSTLIAVMFMGQLLVRIFGLETVTALFS